eukprot:scaffold1225_cov33-Phaeocystis_antarctica.AAC.1
MAPPMRQRLATKAAGAMARSSRSSPPGATTPKPHSTICWVCSCILVGSRSWMRAVYCLGCSSVPPLSIASASAAVHSSAMNSSSAPCASRTGK